MDPQLVLFRRQYLQLFEPDFLAWPPAQLLRNADVQGWLFNNLFNHEKNPHLPPQRYQVRVLKLLVAKIEKAIEDPEEDEISDDLMTHLSALMTELPSELTAVQQRAYVSFTCLPGNASANNEDEVTEEPTITLLERRHLISGSRTTGFRTWEASLHLGAYLLSTPATQDLVRNKSVLELGAGTGFLSILCAKHLGARHITTTDGDEGVVEGLKENMFLNGLGESDQVTASILRWGWALKGTWVADDCDEWPYDVVIGADITYDKVAITALVGTLGELFELRPKLQVVVAGAVRNADTFEAFRQECGMYADHYSPARAQFNLDDIQFEAKPVREQKALFYAAAVPFRIVLITVPTRQE
ncbi:putative methyltransferase-domain-containing protein [Pseudomassariella vexata]|uniref:Putative methyltransferase-domain-containing protein n=1 Tax=Pseudomassariella vexata TaxID=1141098 RepID=A0A1Y2EC11_9PEZI|nr:putative methyltransferase-domain-containing protein [Pseudomassariella vexata]ORY69110.1 putative methyltransferase-domain-containing protein [Pseudomassariella vexata]